MLLALTSAVHTSTLPMELINSNKRCPLVNGGKWITERAVEINNLWTNYFS